MNARLEKIVKKSFFFALAQHDLSHQLLDTAYLHEDVGLVLGHVVPKKDKV